MKFFLKRRAIQQIAISLRPYLTFLLLLCWPAIIWFFFRGCIWVAEYFMYLTGKPLEQSVIRYIQGLITIDMLIDISVSWVVLLLILFILVISISWLLRKLVSHNN